MFKNLSHDNDEKKLIKIVTKNRKRCPKLINIFDVKNQKDISSEKYHMCFSKEGFGTIIPREYHISQENNR